MRNKIDEKICQWDDSTARETRLRLVHLEKRLYKTYEPALAPEPDFDKRLNLWLEGVASNTEDEKLMFNLVPNIFYVGPEEFKQLYWYAYNGPIARWLVDELDIQLDDRHAEEKLIAGLKETWFCPITDSMKINQFYHINKIPAEWNYRPDWRSMAKFGSEEKIRSYCRQKNVKRLVLLEDFVGNGTQMEKAVQFASRFQDIISILVAPLIACPKGVENGLKLKETHGIEFTPVLALDKNEFIPETLAGDENQLIRDIHDFAYRTYMQVSGGLSPGDRKPYHPLGWKQTGALIVMYTNSPNNTLPLIHWRSNEWEPLFPRHDRI